MWTVVGFLLESLENTKVILIVNASIINTCFVSKKQKRTNFVTYSKQSQENSLTHGVFATKSGIHIQFLVHFYMRMHLCDIFAKTPCGYLEKTHHVVVTDLNSLSER